MNNSNVKVYLAISGALIILFILVLVIPFTKRSVTNNQQSTNNFPTPTSVETNQPSVTNPTPITVPADFTGVAEEQLPKEIIDLAAQKKDLRQKVPLNLSAFTIDFDYGEDKFIVNLNEPKDQSQKEFENWRTSNYPALNTDQFLLK
jgi:hypothetical protein